MKFAAKLEPDLYIIEITTTDTFLIVYKWQFSYRCYQIAYSKLTDVLNSQIFRHSSLLFLAILFLSMFLLRQKISKP